MCFSTGVWVYAERRHGGVLVHEAVCDPAIRAFVSVHSVNLQNKSSRWLVLQDRCALSVLLTLRRARERAERTGGRKRRPGNVSMEKVRSILHSVESQARLCGRWSVICFERKD